MVGTRAGKEPGGKGTEPDAPGGNALAGSDTEAETRLAGHGIAASATSQGNAAGGARDRGEGSEPGERLAGHGKYGAYYGESTARE